MFQRPYKTKRPRSYYRHQRNRTIKRKRFIFEVICKNNINEQHGGAKKYLGKFAKGKVHCSCAMCKPWKKYYKEEKSKYKSLIKEIN